MTLFELKDEIKSKSEYLYNIQVKISGKSFVVLCTYKTVPFRVTVISPHVPDLTDISVIFYPGGDPRIPYQQYFDTFLAEELKENVFKLIDYIKYKKLFENVCCACNEKIAHNEPYSFQCQSCGQTFHLECRGTHVINDRNICGQCYNHLIKIESQQVIHIDSMNEVSLYNFGDLLEKYTRSGNSKALFNIAKYFKQMNHLFHWEF